MWHHIVESTFLALLMQIHTFLLVHLISIAIKTFKVHQFILNKIHYIHPHPQINRIGLVDFLLTDLLFLLEAGHCNSCGIE